MMYKLHAWFRARILHALKNLTLLKKIGAQKCYKRKRVMWKCILFHISSCRNHTNWVIFCLFLVASFLIIGLFRAKFVIQGNYVIHIHPCSSFVDSCQMCMLSSKPCFTFLLYCIAYYYKFIRFNGWWWYVFSIYINLPSSTNYFKLI